MIPNTDALQLFRFSEQRWIDKLIEGDVSFSCPGAFIHQAKMTGNNDQGDLFEGVFARLKYGDTKVTSLRKTLGKDLEIIPDGEYVMLRRKSSKKKPIFCYYGYTAEELLTENDVDHPGRMKLKHDIDKRMYSSFAASIDCALISDSHQFTQISLQLKPFIDRIKIAFLENGHSYKMQKIDYNFFADETFYIEPTRNYDELFYKFPQYDYQYEARICVTDVSLPTIFDRWTLNIIPLNKDDYEITHVPLYVELTVDIMECKN